MHSHAPLPPRRSGNTPESCLPSRHVRASPAGAGPQQVSSVCGWTGRHTSPSLGIGEPKEREKHPEQKVHTAEGGNGRGPTPGVGDKTWWPRGLHGNFFLVVVSYLPVFMLRTVGLYKAEKGRPSNISKGLESISVWRGTVMDLQGPWHVRGAQGPGGVWSCSCATALAPETHRFITKST